MRVIYVISISRFRTACDLRYRSHRCDASFPFRWSAHDSETSLPSTVQRHARKPFRDYGKGSSGEPQILCRSHRFIVSDEDRDTIYLRGVAEACHHSLVLKRARGEPQAERVGMRVFSEEDLERAKFFFDKASLP